MTKKEFREFVKDKIIFLDGATGSNLQKRGMPPGVCPELWITQHPEVLQLLQQEYIEAGSRIIYAPTFSANRIKLREYGLEDRVFALNRELVEISRKAAGCRALVAGDITMTGEMLAPMGSLDFEELIEIYKEQIGCMAKAGIDLLVVETMMSLQESRAALIAAKETCPDLPVLVTMTFEESGRSLLGTDARTAAIVLESLGADALGANCSTGPAQMAAVIRDMAEVTSVPLVAKPNAGLPVLTETGETVYEMDAEEFGNQMQLLADAGATILGGCCGTSPAHLACLTRKVQLPIPPVLRKRREERFLTSERRTLAFHLSSPFLIVGERINPTGKKKLQEQLREDNFALVTEFAAQQEERGAAVLDVNLGMSGIDEKSMMLRALEEIAGVTTLPLSLDSSHVSVLEAALRRYPGRALVNSVSLEKEKVEKLLPLVKKYGAMFILLPLSDKGLPQNMEEKIRIIEQIIEAAKSVGLSEEDIVVDGLVATVGANPLAAKETLETIRYCRKKGLATICGLSNISFGLPERSFVNTAFLTMAIQAGLTMAIANPGQEQMAAAAFASDLLLGKEGADLRYIEYASDYALRYPAKPALPPTQGGALPEIKEEKRLSISETVFTTESKTAQDLQIAESKAVYEAVLKGRKKEIEQLTHKALDTGIGAKELLDRELLPAIDKVGELFDQGKYFLPQLVASAETMKKAIGILEPMLATQGDGKKLPVIVIATVEGDIHDIGKNLVALMLKNHGFHVIDLGKDVPKETIVQAAIDNDAQIIALSALMTTTMQEMRQVVAYARKRGVTAKIIIGGAVITQEYADEIQADGYSKDAAEAVRLAKKLLSIS